MGEVNPASLILINPDIPALTPRVFIFPIVYQSGEEMNSIGSVKSYCNHTALILHRLTSCILLYS
jgi:hypothetical protein